MQMPVNRNKQGTARCILTHFLPVGTSSGNIHPSHPRNAEARSEINQLSESNAEEGRARQRSG
ncbi:Uncharacterized protein DBV15_10630 [Temnothorax longispinosus]|uniref:Uncharacterized protein n=1 Tax=Temnothorax longispinosus TaxID=300112 RepID=A0A4S2KB28_9HYME|nr:Uncharacterized protein DBV15_10630 [Temnothorax longispinosus]